LPYKLGFFPSDNGIGVELILLGVHYVQKTIVYYDINWLLVEIITAPSGGTFTAGITRGNVINLVYPRYSYTFGTLYVIRVPASG